MPVPKIRVILGWPPTLLIVRIGGRPVMPRPGARDGRAGKESAAVSRAWPVAAGARAAWSCAVAAAAPGTQEAVDELAGRGPWRWRER